jgi:flagellar P-ring protein precursor FlgI
MFRIIFSLLLLSPCLEAFSQPVKIKDLITIKGVRDNPLLGYGLVIGLNGTGDGGGEIQNTSFKKILKDLGLDLKTELASKNIASVIVTASLPPFARSGQKIDATISAINGASSLAGGTLLITPLKGGDGKIYAIATGQLSIGGLKKVLNFQPALASLQELSLKKNLNSILMKKTHCAFL